MEPDIVRLYSSSPPPLDEGGEEEDEDEFGEFGGYCGGVASSFSLSEFDTPTAFSQSLAAETSPPDLFVASVQSTSTAGKNPENLQTSLASNSKASVYETNVGTGDGGNGEPEPSDIVINGVPPSDLQDSNTVEHKLACNSVPQDFEDINTSQRRDGEGRCHSNGHRKPNAGMEVPTETSFNSTGTDLASRAELSNSPNPLSPDNISQGEVPEAGGTVADEVLTEPQDFSTSKSAQNHSINERLEMQGKEVLSGLEGPSDEETFVSSRDPPPQCGSEDFEDCTEASTGLAAEVGEVSNTRLSEDSVVRNETTGDPAVQLPEVVPGTELGGDFEDDNGTTVDLNVELVHDMETDPVLREGNGNSGVPRIETDEDFGDFRDAVQGFADFSRTESATQEGFADFVTALSGCSTNDDFGDADSLKDLKVEEELPEEQQEEANDLSMEGTWCLALPPSDSFADFSSAPLEGLAEGVGDSWAEFGLQGESEGQQESWAAFDEGQLSSTATAPPSDCLQNDNALTGLTCRLQHLFRSTFPSEVPSELTEVETLQALLEPLEHKENSCRPVQGEAAAMWRHLLDTHSAHGLKVQWVGSRSNRILLDCLGIRNILFTGQKKRPLIVPMFAAGLGMLEPTKDPVKHSPTSPAPSSPGQGRSPLCTQVASSLSSCEDAAGGAVSQLNLDFFGPVEDSSSDSDTDTPIPGVDPELYELTTAKLECNNTASEVADAFNRLMETVEKTSTLARKPESEGAISEEAARVISVIPDLSFMRARVLMFPYTLTPAASEL